MNIFLIDILAIIFCILAEGFFSGSETAFISCDRLRIRHLAETGDRRARLIQNLQLAPERLLGTTLVGTNITTIASSAIATSMINRLLYLLKEMPGGARYEGLSEVWITTLIITPIILILGEIVPKTIYLRKANSIILTVIRPLRVIFYTLYPLSTFFSGIASLMVKLVGKKQEVKGVFVTREELRMLFGEEGSVLGEEERKMIHTVFDFSSTSVKEVMIPLVDVVAVKADSPPSEVLDLAFKTDFTRFPVYKQRIDNIIGILNIFDILYTDGESSDIKRYVRPAYYVPESKKVDRLLQELREKKNHMAIVVDEYGGAAGLVTIKDLLEEIFGEIGEEPTGEIDEIQVLKDGSILADCRIDIDYLNEKFAISLPSGDYETLGGFLINLVERIPQKGESIKFKNWLFSIVEADQRRVSKVKIERLR